MGLLGLLLMSLSSCGLARHGAAVAADSISPDGRYGVTVPSFEQYPGPEDDPGNQLVERKTGRVLTPIRAETGWTRMNRGGVLPARWSKDGSLLVWEVSGRWSPLALVVLKLENGGVKWQTDVLTVAQQAILARTKKAAPERYEAAKKANAGNGSAYPEGFTVNVAVADGPVALPMRVEVDLTSNPKGIEDLPNLDSRLGGVLDVNGRFSVDRFKLLEPGFHPF